MNQFGWATSLAAGVLAVALPELSAQTLDQLLNDKALIMVEVERTRDACDRSNDITITSALGGNVVVRKSETRLFEIDRNKDDYTRSGGWYWKCGESLERSRIRGARYIKVIRNERGLTDWICIEFRKR